MPNEVLSPETKPISPKTADDINDLFKTLDTEIPEKEREIKEPKEKEDKKIKEPKEGDKEDKSDIDDDLEGDEDELELAEPDEDIEKLNLEKTDEEIIVPPRKKEILKKYPELFKDFPFLEKMMYRDRQYSEFFGSFDDAKEVAEKAESFDKLEQQLFSGDTSEVLKEIKENDENAFFKIVDDYLPALARADKEAYYHVTANLNKRLIMEMVAEANKLNNDDLRQAALMVNQFVFGSGDFKPPTTLSKKEEVKSDEAEKERLEYVQERFETARDDLQTRVDNTLRATITDYIDPKGVMTPYVKKNAVNDAMQILEKAITADPSVQKNLNNLWRSSFDNKFSKDSLGKIQSYYLSRAKANLRQAILRARIEALKDLRPANRDKETDDTEGQEEEISRSSQRRVPTGRPSQPRPSKNERRKGESVTEFFMRD